MILQFVNIFLKKKLSIKNIYGYDFLKKDINDITSISATIDQIKFDIKSSWLKPRKNKKNNYCWKEKNALFNELDFDSPIKI